ncbi:hypothetical protein THII_0991 [Thioploca ingrica]|uniref:DUF2442 domain-containing protein n=1 Tax=Thioploca ingrica TaxID=40754 RepID=A0A090AC65_9GAMM|nr:hypothetical protein THII_0991 [Thioploca ingrica]
MFLHITAARYIDNYKVEVQFNNGRKGIADLAEVIKGPIFETLTDKNYFLLLKIDPDLETITWPNGIDIAPEYVYFQAFKNDPQLQDQFKTWGYVF